MSFRETTPYLLVPDNAALQDEIQELVWVASDDLWNLDMIANYWSYNRNHAAGYAWSYTTRFNPKRGVP